MNFEVSVVLYWSCGGQAIVDDGIFGGGLGWVKYEFRCYIFWCWTCTDGDVYGFKLDIVGVVNDLEVVGVSALMLH